MGNKYTKFQDPGKIETELTYRCECTRRAIYKIVYKHKEKKRPLSTKYDDIFPSHDVIVEYLCETCYEKLLIKNENDEQNFESSDYELKITTFADMKKKFEGIGFQRFTEIKEE